MLPTGQPLRRKTTTVGLRSLFTRRRTPASSSPAVQAAAREPLTPAQLADLAAARTEFLRVAEESGLKSLHACSRDGSHWQDDPESVRTMTALIKDAHDTAETTSEDGPHQ